MMRALYSGVAGLRTHQTRMDVIGNNIANVNTVGFKSETVTFSDVLYQTTQHASGANQETGAGGTNAKQIGLGSSVNSISTKITEPGGYQTTNNPFDLMINGDQFFIVNNNGQNFFTKAGNFKVDTLGTLVTSQGYAVMGWLADQEGNIKVDNVSKINLYAPEYQQANPMATTDVSISGNINKEDESFGSVDGTRAINVSFYDNLGYKYQLTIQISQNADNEFGYSLASSALTCNGNPIDGITEANIEAILGANAELTFNEADGTVATPADGKITLNIAGLGIEALPGDITLDVSTITCRGTETALDSSRGDVTDKNSGAGRTVGVMSEVSIAKDGKISASYDNGEQRVIAQIAVASFVNPSGLEKVGDNLFQSTLNSGEFDGIGEDITASGGYFATGVLEMSNVDLAAEFTDMITTQRGYQANSRIITVSDTLLEELINLKR